jgi:uncharacterized protein
MASPSSPQHEPTMEEILASIRKIISEDSNDSQPAAAAPAPRAAPRAPAPAAAEVDVLELTQEIQEVPAPAPVVQAAPAPVMVTAAPAPQPVARPADDIVFQSVEEAPVSVVTPTPSSGGFVSDKARQAIDDSLSGLTFGAEAPAAPKAAAPRAPLPVDSSSIAAIYEKAVRDAFDPVLRVWLHDQADVVIERIKPAIREWMDENLPAMLKSAVEEEVARAINKPKR